MLSFSVIGLMSGSSLDGVDLAWVDLVFTSDQQPQLHSWNIRHGETIEYTKKWREKLKAAPSLNGKDLWQLHADLGHFFGQQIAVFLTSSDKKPDFIASHGHTVFHFPETGSTTQIGDGAAIAAELGMIVIDQFRTLDVALGGQGAPLAPLADQYFFAEYFACLNLGGIANISIQTPLGYRAFDIGGANQLLNTLAQELGLAYDHNGELARQGKLIPSLLNAANSLPYHQLPYPKSLDNNWVQSILIPLFQNKDQPVKDRLHTACIHIAQQIEVSLKQLIKNEDLILTNKDKIFISGGGAFNGFLCEKIMDVIHPIERAEVDHSIADFKEAALIALAGALRWMKIPNVLPEVTGASKASVGGAIHYGL